MNLDRQKAEAMGVSVADVFIALQANMGSFYVNDFNYLSRVFQVIVQAESDYRSTVSDIGRIYVRSSNDEMIPLSTLIDVTTVLGPAAVERLQPVPFSRRQRAAGGRLQHRSGACRHGRGRR